MAAIASIVAMILAHPPPAGEGHARRLGFVGAGAVVLAFLILLGVAFIVGIANWLHFIQSLGPDEAPHPLFVPMFLGSAWVSILNPYVCAVFVGLVAWCVVLSRQPEHFSKMRRLGGQHADVIIACRIATTEMQDNSDADAEHRDSL
jgi:ABC-type Fe3+ transport system permease subunit